MAGGKTVDWTTLDAPPELTDKIQAELLTESKMIGVKVGDKTVNVYVETVSRKDSMPSLDVLFLHGMRFSSKEWLDIKSFYQVANWGYWGVAVDLPGYGKSTEKLEPDETASFLESLIALLGLNKPVIISPSMSGSFSLPYIFSEPDSSTDRTMGYVPVAPIHTEKFVEQFKKSQVPTLIVVGTNDEINGKESTENLKNLPNHQYAPIEGASHPCYLDNPEAFHKMLYFFLKQLKA